jgi:hypothetical protein
MIVGGEKRGPGWIVDQSEVILQSYNSSCAPWRSGLRAISSRVSLLARKHFSNSRIWTSRFWFRNCDLMALTIK